MTQKFCSKCKLEKDISDFCPRKDRNGKLRTNCRECWRIRQKENYHNHKKKNPFKCRGTKLKSTAKTKGVSFNLTPEYLQDIWTGFCPITGIELKWETDRIDKCAAELDRFIPQLGYIVGNVGWISRKMNRLKNSADTEDLKKLLQWMEKNESREHSR